MFLYKCVLPARFFVNRLLQALRIGKQKIMLTNEIHRDLSLSLLFTPLLVLLHMITK